MFNIIPKTRQVFASITLSIGRPNKTQRHHALGITEGELSFREIAMRMDCFRIMKLVERITMTGSVSDRQRPGRKRVTSRQQDRHIFFTYLRDRFGTSVQTAVETVRINYQRISAPKVRRRLRERDIGSQKAYRGTSVRRQIRYSW